MVHDELSDESHQEQIIEILVDNMWMPAKATDLRIMTKDRALNKVEAIRVRNLGAV
jgi:hypothetical protein